MTTSTILPACIVLAVAVILMALGVISGRERQALRRHGCRHRHSRK